MLMRHLADAASVSLGHLSHIENGRYRATEDVTNRLASALDVPVEVLTGQTPAVRHLADALEVSMDDLADAVGCDRARLRSVADGVAGPTPYEVQRLAVRLGVDADALGLGVAAGVA